MADGFLSRWSRRKIQGEEAQESERPSKELAEITAPTTDEQAPPPVTLEDVEKIDRFAPDFSSFMQPNVDPAVQQAALKKMFTDPHFNIMDGLDIYIDDYSKSDPIPAEMLKRMVQSDMLSLFKNQDAQPLTEEQQAQKIISGNVTDLTSTPNVQSDVSPIEPVQKKNT